MKKSNSQLTLFIQQLSSNGLTWNHTWTFTLLKSDTVQVIVVTNDCSCHPLSVHRRLANVTHGLMSGFSPQSSSFIHVLPLSSKTVTTVLALLFLQVNINIQEIDNSNCAWRISAIVSGVMLCGTGCTLIF